MTKETALKVFESTLNRLGLRGKVSQLSESMVITVDGIENKYSIVAPDRDGNMDVFAAADGRSTKVAEACPDIRSAFMVVLFGIVGELEHMSAAVVMENIGKAEIGKYPHKVICPACSKLVDEANFNYKENTCADCLGIPVSMTPAPNS